MAEPYSYEYDEQSGLYLVKNHYVVVDSYMTHEEAFHCVYDRNIGYTAGRRDALAEIEQRRDKREEL